MTINTTISALPPSPSRSNSPTEFESRSDALFVALPTLVGEVNQLVPEINQTVQAINVSTANAAESELSAWDAAALAGQKLQLATAQAQLATTNGEAQVLLAAEQATRAINEAITATQKASAAAQSALYAEQLFDQFGDKWLTPKTADPLTDDDGDPLQGGAMYLNTASGFVRAYTGTAWVQGISAIAGVNSINGKQGDVSLVIADIQGLVTALAGKSNIDDIINVLTDTSTNKPLSAAQGKALKDTLDALTQTVSGKQASLQTATQAEMEAGTEAAIRAMSPVLVKQAILKLAKGTSNGKLFFMGGL